MSSNATRRGVEGELFGVPLAALESIVMRRPGSMELPPLESQSVISEQAQRIGELEAKLSQLDDAGQALFDEHRMLVSRFARLQEALARLEWENHALRMRLEDAEAQVRRSELQAAEAAGVARGLRLPRRLASG